MRWFRRSRRRDEEPSTSAALPETATAEPGEERTAEASAASSSEAETPSLDPFLADLVQGDAGRLTLGELADRARAEVQADGVGPETAKLLDESLLSALAGGQLDDLERAVEGGAVAVKFMLMRAWCSDPDFVAYFGATLAAASSRASMEGSLKLTGRLIEQARRELAKGQGWAALHSIQAAVLQVQLAASGLLRDLVISAASEGEES